ncbi:MAG TPA: TIGR03084 family metal-binding protein, partial [Micromonosporaceae bacterium]|nr:TIGR03084 family metal-binding protein [Micromonosporaceae bacterium]
MVDLAPLLTDLADESAELDALVAPLTDAQWARPTPAEGWTIAHQIAHLAWTDHATLLAATDPDGFAAQLEALADDPLGFVDRGADEFLAPPAELLSGWRAGRAALAKALAEVPLGVKLPWYGPPMSPPTMATARIMETWAHADDVAAALGVRRQPTDRLRHIAHLGVRTLANGFLIRGLDAPATPVRVELTAPSGALWTFGPEDAADRVVGPAVDFCLLVTRRRHRADLALQAKGPIADRWLD